jgi:hypothetical protein
MGCALFFGLAGFVTFTGWLSVISAMFIGGGLVGTWVFVFRMLTFDKEPVVSETVITPIFHEDEQEPAPPIGGNVNTSIQPQDTVSVEHNGHIYKFTPEQMRLMIDRLDSGRIRIARDPLKFKPGDDYNLAVHCMEGNGYWHVERTRGNIKSVEWTDDGIEWLRSKAR